MELLEKINALMDEIDTRIIDLRGDLRDEPDHNKNHIASMISGEIDGLEWVKEQMKELEI